MMVLLKGGEGQKPPFTPSEQWLEEFTKQLSAEGFYDKLFRYAKRRARLVAFVRQIDPDGYATDLVANVIDDTVEGRLSWDYKRCDLRKHVRDHVKSRSRHEYVRGCKKRTLGLADPRAVRMLDELAASEPETGPEKAARIESANQIVDAIHTRAAGDPEVKLLLEAYERGAETRAEVLEMVTLTKLQYDAARKRLDRMIDELPNNQVTSAQRSR